MFYGKNLTAKLWFRLITYLLMITTQSLMITTAYANVLIAKNIKQSEQEIFDQYVSDANVYGKEILRNAPKLNINDKGEIIHNDKVIMDKKTLTGVKDNDFVPNNDPESLYGNDLKILIAGEKANAQYKNKINSSGDQFDNATAQSYDLLKQSFGKQKPTYGDDDPFFDATDDIFTNLEELAEEFANCEVVTDKYPSGNDIHVEKLETCERVVALEDSFTVTHAYEVGVVKHESGAININSCGDGCLKTWIGTIGDNYWGGWCTIFEEEMSIQVLRPDAITNVNLEYSKFDDYHQVWINNTKVYNAPNGNFPPETGGECELNMSWELYPNVNLTEYYRNIEPKGVIDFKTRTSVAGNGEGFSRIQINYDPKKIVSFDEWATPDQIEKAKKIEQQIESGICTGSIQCIDMPVLDENKCAVINGVKVCENNFAAPPLKNISPFCKKVAVNSSCGNREVCWENLDGETVCHDNSISTNKCQQYTDNNFPNDPDKRCSFKKSECLDGGMGANGTCYIYTDTYDCGFTVNDGTEGEVDSIVCDGKLQCVGESCYKADKDLPNNEFGEAVAYLEMLTFAKNDMKCENHPDQTYDPNEPVDEYLPVPVCPVGYKFDTVSSKCLKILSCEYDEKNYYAVDPRIGIEVLFNGGNIVKSSDVKKCSPVKNGNNIFNCGDEKQKLGTDSYYEVCRNQFTDQSGLGCPDTTHELDPVSGFCRVVPIKSCPNGYELIDLGGDKFNPNNFICRATPIKPVLECPANAPNMNTETGKCTGIGSDDSWFECPEGQLEGDKCKFQQDIIKYCPEGELNTDKCKLEQDVIKICPQGQLINGDKCRLEQVPTDYCPQGQLLNGKCRLQQNIIKYCPQGQLNGEKCRLEKDYIQYCPAGQLNGNQCRLQQDVIKHCPQGQLNGDKCRLEQVPTDYCPQGQLLNGKCRLQQNFIKYCPQGQLNGNNCVLEKNPNLSCPAGQLANNRCEITKIECEYAYKSRYGNVGRYTRPAVYWDGARYDMNNDGFNWVQYGNNFYKFGARIQSSQETAWFEACKRSTTYNAAQYKCDSGYALNGDKCIKEIPAVNKCENGYSINGNYCIKDIPVSEKCNSGYNMVGGVCLKEVPASIKCNSGYTLNGKYCIKDIPASIKCDSGYSLDGKKCIKDIPATNKCNAGYSISGNYCIKDILVSVKCNSGYTLNNGVCVKNIPANNKCNSGYELIGDSCVRNIAATNKCPNGYNIVGGYCIKHNSADRVCPTGSVFNPNSGVCEHQIMSDIIYICPDKYDYDAVNKICTRPDVPATESCPAAFPNFDEETRSCKKKKPSISDHINKSFDGGFNLIDFNHFNQVSGVNEHLEEQKNLVAKERMLKYAKNKLAILTNEANKLTPEEKKIYNNFKKNLFNTFVAESSQGRFNVNVEQESKDSGTGNVSCTLFPAESAYCKVAVGGMQDCCENPAPTSMGDYINMTKTMLTLDGLTAELELIGDYSGIWQPAKDYVSGLVDDAVTNISETLFSSGADTASGQIAETVTMDTLKQSAMKYANEIIIDLFGEDVAGMLFQEVAGSATNEIALSSGMQTAATAFMYLYYVYMVYVVVNLLINIIWECTEDEMNLAMKRDLLSAHKVGSYCHKKVLGLCVEKRDTFCVYNSPVSRIMMEQIHLQPQMNALGYNYGEVKNPTCKSLTTDDIAKVDFNKVDLSEWIAILIQTDNMPNSSNVSIDSLTGKDSYLNTSDEVDKQRLDIIKQSQERIKDIDADSIYNDSYDIKWSTLQDEAIE